MTSHSIPGPVLRKGALVQLVPDIIGAIIPNIVIFQYNPVEITHTITPWNPQEVDQAQRGAQMPTVQPFNPQESFSLALDLDVTDDLEERNPTALRHGIAARLAALKKLTYPSEGLFGDLVRNFQALVGGDVSCRVTRPTVPVILFIWGPGRILPVRVTSFSVVETLYSPMLDPWHAKVTLGLDVMTPDSFRGTGNITEEVAIAAYSYTRLLDDVLAIVNALQNTNRMLGLPPFI